MNNDGFRYIAENLVNKKDYLSHYLMGYFRDTEENSLLAQMDLIISCKTDSLYNSKAKNNLDTIAKKIINNISKVDTTILEKYVAMKIDASKADLFRIDNYRYNSKKDSVLDGSKFKTAIMYSGRIFFCYNDSIYELPNNQFNTFIDYNRKLLIEKGNTTLINYIKDTYPTITIDRDTHTLTITAKQLEKVLKKSGFNKKWWKNLGEVQKFCSNVKGEDVTVEMKEGKLKISYQVDATLKDEKAKKKINEIIENEGLDSSPFLYLVHIISNCEKLQNADFGYHDIINYNTDQSIIFHKREKKSKINGLLKGTLNLIPAYPQFNKYQEKKSKAWSISTSLAVTISSAIYLHNLDILKNDATNAKNKYFSSIGMNRKTQYNKYLKANEKFRDAKYIGNWDYKYWKKIAIWTSVGIYTYGLYDAIFNQSNNSNSKVGFYKQNNNKTYSVIPFIAPMENGMKFGIDFKW